MMNKKYFMHLLAAMMVAMMSVGFASCSSDDPAAELTYETAVLKSFEGTWGLISTKTSETEVGDIAKYLDSVHPSKLVITRPGDNKLNFTMYVWDEGKNDWSQTYSGSVLDGSKTRAGGVEYLPHLVIQMPDGTKFDLLKSGNDSLLLRNTTTVLTFERMD